MTADKVLQALRVAGYTVTREGDYIAIVPSPPADVIAIARAHKPEILGLLAVELAALASVTDEASTSSKGSTYPRSVEAVAGILQRRAARRGQP